MKIGTITVHNGRNYGASLQAFALVQFLRNNGFEASLIDYRTKKIEDRMNSYQTVRRGSSSAFKENLRMLTSNLLFDTKNHTARTEEKFTEFHQRFMEKDSGTFYFCEELSELTEKYDAFICGSDQIWNKNITDLDGAFFLEFAKKSNRKIAYAPSLGMPSENVDEETRKLLQKKLANLDFLSIREKNNRELIEQLTHRQCEVVADPVLLLEREEWDDVLDMSEDVCPKEPYAFYYPIVDQPELLEYAMKESKKEAGSFLIRVLYRNMQK